MSNFHAPGSSSSERILHVRLATCFQPFSCSHSSDWDVSHAKNTTGGCLRKESWEGCQYSEGSPSVQKLCVLSVGRGYLVSVVTSPAFNGISSESALIHQISEVTFCNSQQQYSFAELLTLLWDARAMWSSNWEKYQIFTPFRSLCGCAGCFTGCLKDAVFVTLTF